MNTSTVNTPQRRQRRHPLPANLVGAALAKSMHVPVASGAPHAALGAAPGFCKSRDVGNASKRGPAIWRPNSIGLEHWCWSISAICTVTALGALLEDRPGLAIFQFVLALVFADRARAARVDRRAEDAAKRHGKRRKR